MYSGHRHIDWLVLAGLWLCFTGGAFMQAVENLLSIELAVVTGASLFLLVFVTLMSPLLRAALFRIFLVFLPVMVVASVAVFLLLDGLTETEKQRVYPALVTGTVLVLGWFVTYLSSTFREVDARERERRDALVSLKHEIFALVDKLDNQPIEKHAKTVQERIENGDGQFGRGQPKEYQPFSTMESEPIVFEAIAPTIPTLDEETVGPVVRFYAEYTDLRRMVEDSRSAQIQKLPRERRVAFHKQLTKRRKSTLRWGLKALVAIGESLGDSDPTNIERSGENPEIQA